MVDTQRATIMVVDDTPSNLVILEAMLSFHEYDVVSFSGGEMALDAVMENQPDLILLDIMMPEMDGYEVCGRLKEDESTRDIPVIFISGLDETGNKVKAFTSGGVDYITKPFHDEEVAARIDTHLRLVRLQNELKAQNDNLEELIAERTRELERVNQKLIKSDQLKDDFLQMITHETRTPANGILGLGELLVDSLPNNEENHSLIISFQSSCDRLRKLLDDAALIGRIDRATSQEVAPLLLKDLMAYLRLALPDLKIYLEGVSEGDLAFLTTDEALLMKALQTAFILATFYLKDPNEIRVMAVVEDNTLKSRINLDKANFTEEQANFYFDLEYSGRGSTLSESLALGPVVADKILRAIGGGLKMAKLQDKTGYIEISLPLFEQGN